MTLHLALASLVASFGDDGEHWWIVAPFFWALWLAVIATVVFLVFRRRPWGPRRDDHARAILAERLARGEISADEFRERLEALR
jgi:putative membrane protein